MITFICLMVVSVANLVTFLQWRRADKRLQLMRSWLAEEERAEERLLEQDPDFAASLGIKRKIDTRERIIEYRGQPPQVTQLAEAIRHHGMSSPMVQQALQAKQAQGGPMLGGIGIGAILGNIGSLPWD